MEPYMFTNGLPILFYFEIIELLKIRQISKAMRKRVAFITKDKKTKVSKEHQEKARKLTKWVYLRDNENCFPFKDIGGPYSSGQLYFSAEILEETSEGLQKRIPFRQYCLIKDITESFPSLYFDRMNYCFCSQERMKFMTKHTFELIDALTLPNKYCPEIKEAMSAIKKVTSLRILSFFPDLSGVEWLKSLKILEISGADVNVELELPSLTKMTVFNSVGISKLKCPKLEHLIISSWDYHPKEIIGFTNLKHLQVNTWCFYKNENYLPKELRHIEITYHLDPYSLNIKAIVKQCPRLFSFNYLRYEFDIADFQGGNLRKIYFCDKTDLKGQSTVRLKDVTIQNWNGSLFKKHPEIISKATKFDIHCHDFDWKWLPYGTKKLIFDNCMVIGEKKIKKQIDKLKGCYITSITVEKASSAREIMKVAAKVEEIFCSDQLEELKKEFQNSGCQFKNVIKSAKKKETCCLF